MAQKHLLEIFKQSIPHLLEIFDFSTSGNHITNIRNNRLRNRCLRNKFVLYFCF